MPTDKRSPFNMDKHPGSLLRLLLAFVLLQFSVSAWATQVLDNSYILKAEPQQLAPTSFEAVPAWIRAQQETSLSLTGGSYWMVHPLRVASREQTWVIDVRNSIIESIDLLLLGQDGSKQQAHSGYDADYQYLFDYGRRFTIKPGIDYWLVVKVESRYYSSAPEIRLAPEIEHRLSADRHATAVVLCLGGLIFIACYNLFIFFTTRDKAFFWYGLYVLAYFGGWALTFHLPAHLFQFRQLELHHLFFISLPILNILFYNNFLQLSLYSPKLWRLSRILLWACVLALPTSIWFLSYTAIIASVLIMLWIGLAIVCGNVCLMKGFSPARYFIMAFSCLLLPAIIILPGNMGITPDFFEYAELATLLGGTADALLLSLALASKLKLLSEERQEYIRKLGIAWERARSDSLTGLANRLAYDESLADSCLSSGMPKPGYLLVLLDIEGLKRVNDTLGHGEGDRLLLAVAEELQSWSEAKLKPFRISGNDFALLLPEVEGQRLQNLLPRLEQRIASEGFAELCVNHGSAASTDKETVQDWVRAADKDLYQCKSLRRRELHARQLAAAEGLPR
ncbi:MAG: 7TM diverse intracellular signaling domain-containing protein [Shewanella indica]|uniref:diguanylate cyclase n=2 Tax=Shewanellaceae TaxID=267890 RepID=A0ABU4Q7R0_9GAMM|nr:MULTISPECIES: GGDEF domain-containing protein [Shewanella]MDX6014886.1 7TM diverse intracellular signaling domain-containing protein [Shewanella indica]BCV37448.1 diguanylate cyclase [Shewanella chilikensis]